MGLSGNRGEWSEVYVLLKLLADGALAVGEAAEEATQEKLLPIVKIIRHEANGNELTFDYVNSMHGRVVRIRSSSTGETIHTPLISFALEAIHLLDEIKSLESSQEIPRTENFLRKIGCKQIKRSSSSKSDINIVIHDAKAYGDVLLGFSIKSQLGGEATLVNSSKATNFSYLIEPRPSESLKRRVNATRLFSEKLNVLRANKKRLSFCGVDSNCFAQNLVLIDSLMPNLLAGALVIYYSGIAKRTAEIVDCLQEDNPLEYATGGINVYSYKMKKFLVESALGMTAAKAWDGVYDATGGTIIVKDDGNLVLYNLYDRNLFESFLLQNTHFDTPSTKRYGFGQIDDNSMFKLNLQIRFE